MKAKLVSYDKCKSIKVDLDTTRFYMLLVVKTFALSRVTKKCNVRCADGVRGWATGVCCDIQL
jgi:hypothetical protein